jgi:hypothetical protein
MADFFIELPTLFALLFSFKNEVKLFYEDQKIEG